MRRLTISLIASTLTILLSTTHAADLLQVYQQAQHNDMTFKAAKETYLAAQQNNPIARGALLPQLALTANTTYNRVSPAAATGTSRYNTNQYTLTLTQPLFDLSAWYTYGQIKIHTKQAAVTYAQSQQTLIQNVANTYFQVLEDQDKLRYATKNEESLKQQMTQTQEQFKVGLKAYTDVQSVRASYESAVASRVETENQLHNDLQSLAAMTGRQEQALAPLKANFPLITPDPDNPEQWVTFAYKHNLQLISDQLGAQSSQAGIEVAKAGTATTPGYWPAVNIIGSYDATKDHSDSNGRVFTTSGQLNLSWDLFNGGITYHTVKQSRYTHQAAVYTAEQTKRNTASGVRQALRNIVSDISQVKALRQAVISGESSVKATRAAYEVGTRTIVDLLNEQSNLFNSQQQYADAIFKYITDSLSLKFQAGILTEQDIVAINQWLQPQIASTTNWHNPIKRI